MAETTIREKPILFSGEMVRAILDGRKTQTRRVIKPQHAEGIELDDDQNFSFMHSPTCGGGCDWACASSGEVVDGHIGWTPWGSNPRHWGRLWVRETWRANFDGDLSITVNYQADDTVKDFYADQLPESSVRPSFLEWTWKPSIHMPRWASRLTLEITDIRVERAQEISESDAEAEGCPGERWATGHGDYSEIAPSEQFRELWDSINGKRPGCSWADNPWVWAISFRRIEERDHV